MVAPTFDVLETIITVESVVTGSTTAYLAYTTLPHLFNPLLYATI